MRISGRPFNPFADDSAVEVKEIEKIKKKDLTILSALDQLVEICENGRLKLDCLSMVKTTVTFITKKLDIAPIQAMLLAPIVNH